MVLVALISWCSEAMKDSMVMSTTFNEMTVFGHVSKMVTVKVSAGAGDAWG